jgi:hypothetical protein
VDDSGEQPGPDGGELVVVQDVRVVQPGEALELVA